MTHRLYDKGSSGHDMQRKREREREREREKAVHASALYSAPHALRAGHNRTRGGRSLFGGDPQAERLMQRDGGDGHRRGVARVLSDDLPDGEVTGGATNPPRRSRSRTRGNLRNVLGLHRQGRGGDPRSERLGLRRSACDAFAPRPCRDCCGAAKCRGVTFDDRRDVTTIGNDLDLMRVGSGGHDPEHSSLGALGTGRNLQSQRGGPGDGSSARAATRNNAGQTVGSPLDVGNGRASRRITADGLRKGLVRGHPH